jgi:hypothetical protein
MAISKAGARLEHLRCMPNNAQRKFQLMCWNRQRTLEVIKGRRLSEREHAGKHKLVTDAINAMMMKLYGEDNFPTVGGVQ